MVFICCDLIVTGYGLVETVRAILHYPLSAILHTLLVDVSHEKVPFFQCQHPNVWMAWIRELSNNQNQPLSCWFPPEKSFPEIRVGIPCYVFPQILRRSSRKLPPNLPNGSKKQIDL